MPRFSRNSLTFHRLGESYQKRGAKEHAPLDSIPYRMVCSEERNVSSKGETDHGATQQTPMARRRAGPA
jgi:hypothetical protein